VPTKICDIYILTSDIYVIYSNDIKKRFSEDIYFMSDKRRMAVMIPEPSYQKLLAMAGSERKLGETVTDLIENASDIGPVSDGLDVDSLRWQVVGLASDVKRLEADVIDNKMNLAKMIADRH